MIMDERTPEPPDHPGEGKNKCDPVQHSDRLETRDSPQLTPDEASHESAIEAAHRHDAMALLQDYSRVHQKCRDVRQHNFGYVRANQAEHEHHKAKEGDVPLIRSPF